MTNASADTAALQALGLSNYMEVYYLDSAAPSLRVLLSLRVSSVTLESSGACPTITIDEAGTALNRAEGS
ncbi:hypothetical protein MKX08_000540 [Trichoderma sp. CBMAI-0020]|nr:hypothetical protein MKX08_000540 [Trichoderma sp. CBMAI-0020]